MTEFVLVFFQLLVTVLWLLVVGRVLLSWINPRFEGPVARFLYDTTEPLLAPIRRFLPRTGMLDLAPLVLVFALAIVLRLVLYL